MPPKRHSTWQRIAKRLHLGDVAAYGFVGCTTAASAAFPFYVHFHQDKFGPPLMQFYGADEQAAMPQVVELSFERQKTAFLKPRLELDKITTSAIRPVNPIADLPQNTVSERQPFPDAEPVASTKFQILFVSAGRLLAVDGGRVLSLKPGSLLSDGSRIQTINRSGSGWEVRTSSGNVVNWAPGTANPVPPAPVQPGASHTQVSHPIVWLRRDAGTTMQVNGIFGLASQQANWLSVRQQTIAENISHANIPDYVAKDTEPFKALVAGKQSALARTDPRHMMPSDTTGGVKRVDLKAPADGRDESVNVETELMKSIEVRNGYEMNTAIVKAFHRMILTAAKA